MQDPQKLYEELAAQCERRQEPLQRDVFLVLAADTALSHGHAEQAEILRKRLLGVSPYTLLRPFASFAEAVKSADIRDYIVDLRQQYPPSFAAKLLQKPDEINGSILDQPDLFGDSTESVMSIFEHVSEPPPPIVEHPSRPSAVHLPAPTVAQDEASKERKRPVKARRPSPYDNPDYGPRVPAKPAMSEEALGNCIIYALVAVVVLAALAMLGHMLVRPFIDF